MQYALKPADCRTRWGRESRRFGPGRHHLIKQILDAAADAAVIATPCPLCQTNIEMYQDAVNKKFGTSHNIPAASMARLGLLGNVGGSAAIGQKTGPRREEAGGPAASPWETGARFISLPWPAAYQT